MKKLVLAMIILLTMGIVSSCSGQKSSTASSTGVDSELGTKGEVHIGISPNYPPFESMDGNKLVGFDVDLMNKIGEMTKLKVVYDQMDFETIITALNAGQVDIGVSGFTYKKDRDVIFGTPYLQSAQVVLLPANSTITSVADLKGKRVGAEAGSTGDAAARKIDGAIVSNPDNDMTFQMVQTGQLDACICDLGVAANFVATGNFKMLPDRLTDEPMSMIIKNGNTELEKTFNYALTKYMATDDYKALVKKYGLE